MDYKSFFDAREETLLVARDEMTWMDRYVEPDRSVGVFMNMGCGSSRTPHLLLDSVAVLKTLGVEFVAGSGRQFCCGNVYRMTGKPDASRRMSEAAVERMMSWGARTIVHWCTACMRTFTHWSEELPQDMRLENIHIHTFIEARLRELGDRVPWQRKLDTRVLVEGHPENSAVHARARADAARMLALVPGVEVLGFIDAPESWVATGDNCGSGNSLDSLTKEDVGLIREDVGKQVRARGADTVSCQHQRCHRTWSKLSSQDVTVKQCVSIIAEALGFDHPDRFQSAFKLSSPEAAVHHLRRMWTSWEISEDEALGLARQMIDPRYADPVPSCACNGDLSKCGGEELISVGAGAAVDSR